MAWRRLIGCAGAVLAAALLTSCTSGDGSSRQVSPHPVPDSAATSVTAAAVSAVALNKRAAQAEADRLVSAAVLPRGVTRTQRQPAGLSGPALGTPQTSQLIDSVRYYRVAMSLARADAWFHRTSQPGLKQSGTSSSGGRGGPSGYGFQYEPSPYPRWTWGTADLEIGLTSAGAAATAIRVDGMAQWTDPTPTRDDMRGRKVRVIAADGCPATDRDRSDVDNPDDADLDHDMLPATAPLSALKCSYDGMNGKAFALVGSRRLTAMQAEAAAKKIRSLPPLGSRGSGPISCPMDDGRADIIVFSYRNRRDIDIWEHTSGCASTDNGHIITAGV